MILKVENISKRYDSQIVLDSVSFEIEKGNSAAIVGPSGSGKTTFLNIIGALDVPDSGSVIFNNQNLRSLSENEKSAFRNKHIGFVFQMHYLLPQLTVFENVLIPTLTYTNKADKHAAEKRATLLLDSLGMINHRDKLPGQLSGGECQRTAFARALINQPELILADEPTGSLDAKAADSLSSELIRLNKEFGTTLLVVTHSEHLAQKMNTVWEFRGNTLYKQ